MYDFETSYLKTHCYILINLLVCELLNSVDISA